MAAPPTVVHLQRKNGVEVVSCDLYVGRPMYQGGWRLPGSKWANPFSLKTHGGDLGLVLAKYEEHVRGRPDLLAALPELTGLRLGCWCVTPVCALCGKLRPCGHLQCHAEVLIKLWGETLKLAPTLALPATRCRPPSRAIISDDDPFWGEYDL
jgi:hypothetical protein